MLKLRIGELAMYLWILHVITTHRSTPEVVNPAEFSNGYSEYQIVCSLSFIIEERNISRLQT